MNFKGLADAAACLAGSPAMVAGCANGRFAAADMGRSGGDSVMPGTGQLQALALLTPAELGNGWGRNSWRVSRVGPWEQFG